MNFLCKLFGGTYDHLWKAIIRPGRDEYLQEELGPFKFEIKGNCYKRTDFELINNRGLKLICSFWEPFDEEREKVNLPCVIYLHGNSSSRCEAYAEVKYLLPKNICLFSFDFCGCGKSEGDYISLGYYEKEDVHCVIEYLLKSKKVSKIGLWGRSMGAVTAIMYASEHPSNISALILDSGFYSLNTLIHELVNSRVNLPNFIIDKVLNSVKETVREKAGFSLDEIEPYLYARKCITPAFFCHGEQDNFVFTHHCNDLYNDYKGSIKLISSVKGNHNSSRPVEFKKKATEFLYKYLKDDDYENDETLINCNTFQRFIIRKNNFIPRGDYDDDDKYRQKKLRQKYSSNKDNSLNSSKNSVSNYQNRGSTDEAGLVLNKNASQNMRAYSQNNYSKNDLKMINIKNSVNNLQNYNNFNINVINLNNNKFMDNDNSNSSSSIIEEPSVYTKNTLQKDTIINQPRVRSISLNNAIKKNKMKMNSNGNSNNFNKNNINFNFNPSFINVKELNKQNSINYDSNISTLKDSNSNNNIQIDKNIRDQAGRTFTENFFKQNSNNNKNNYFIASSLYFNNYKGINNKKNDYKKNFYKSKRPLDKENSLFRKRMKIDEIKPFNLKENPNKNFLINKNNNLCKEEEKITINTVENTILDENEEIIGRNLPH